MALKRQFVIVECHIPVLKAGKMEYLTLTEDEVAAYWHKADLEPSSYQQIGSRHLYLALILTECHWLPPIW